MGQGSGEGIPTEGPVTTGSAGSPEIGETNKDNVVDFGGGVKFDMTGLNDVPETPAFDLSDPTMTPLESQTPSTPAAPAAESTTTPETQKQNTAREIVLDIIINDPVTNGDAILKDYNPENPTAKKMVEAGQRTQEKRETQLAKMDDKVVDLIVPKEIPDVAQEAYRKEILKTVDDFMEGYYSAPKGEESGIIAIGPGRSAMKNEVKYLPPTSTMILNARSRNYKVDEIAGVWSITIPGVQTSTT